MKIETAPDRPTLFAFINDRGRITVTRHHADETRDSIRLSASEARRLADALHDLLDLHLARQR